MEWLGQLDGGVACFEESAAAPSLASPMGKALASKLSQLTFSHLIINRLGHFCDHGLFLQGFCLFHSSRVHPEASCAMLVAFLTIPAPVKL